MSQQNVFLPAPSTGPYSNDLSLSNDTNNHPENEQEVKTEIAEFNEDIDFEYLSQSEDMNDYPENENKLNADMSDFNEDIDIKDFDIELYSSEIHTDHKCAESCTAVYHEKESDTKG